LFDVYNITCSRIIARTENDLLLFSHEMEDYRHYDEECTVSDHE
jgi:hypothetical protein